MAPSHEQGASRSVPVTVGCIGVKHCGFQFNVRLPKPLLSATFSYKFKFSEGYTWTSGGKLPGVCSEGARPSRVRSHKLTRQ